MAQPLYACAYPREIKIGQKQDFGKQIFLAALFVSLQTGNTPDVL